VTGRGEHSTVGPGTKKATVSNVSRRVAVPLIACGLSLLAQHVSPEMQAHVIRAIDAAQVYRDTNLAGYSVIEHYTISNSHFSAPAEVVVQTTFKRSTGKTFEVLSRNGPSILKNRVMDRILEEEAKISRGTTRLQSLITSDNYDMRLIGEEKIGDTPCLALELMPKRKSPHLLRGKLWVDSRSKAVLRIDGQPPVGVSFFEGRPEVVRDYALSNGIALAQRSRATSSGLIQGKTEITIVYDNYVVERDSAR
jgi:hypothetical protein